MTILSILTLFIYFAFMLSDVVNRNRYILTETDYMRNLYADTSLYNISISTFDHAVYPVYLGNNPEVTNIHQYFTVRYFYVVYTEK